MAKIENTGPAVVNEVITTKRRDKILTGVAKVLTGMLVVSLIIAVSLLLVGFLAPAGLVYSVYLAVLVTAGCVAQVSLATLVGTLSLRCFLNRGSKKISPLKESVKVSNRSNLKK